MIKPAEQRMCIFFVHLHVHICIYIGDGAHGIDALFETLYIAVRLWSHVKLWMKWRAHFPVTLFPSTFWATTTSELFRQWQNFWAESGS